MARRKQRDRTDELIERETDAAAEEAADIGGEPGDEDLDPAERPVIEGGGGEAEGFELAEEDLREQAEHGEGRSAIADSYRQEEESKRAGAEHGEADELETTEGEDDRA
jgi:hypothetical protein